MICYFRLFLFLSLSSFVVGIRQLDGKPHKFSSEFSKFNHVEKGHFHNNGSIEGKRWAVLIAGSRGYGNYRHQADICHAYQNLKSGGLQDDNIIVFMYDDIAFSADNPRPGIIINKPNGNDVYKGVPKDYIGENVNVNNFFAVILGNKTALVGGSGKVVDSSPNDRIFIYYADHGSPGFLGMPSGDDLTAKDLIDVLKKKHEAKSYKSMVIYVEACESGSMFDGILPRNLNIYAVTAADPNESSWGTYCPGDYYPTVPPEFDTCLGDLFSISWMEDSDIHNLRKETLEMQYQVVRRRTAVDNLDSSSHVMQYGSLKVANDSAFSYLGTNPENDNFAAYIHNFEVSSNTSNVVSQHDASLLHFWLKFHKASEGSLKKAEAHKELLGELSQRKHIDESIKEIIKVLFRHENVLQMLKSVQPAGKPLVDDWNCFKMLVNTFKKYCVTTSRSRYEMKYSGAFANMCNAGVDMKHATATIIEVCTANSPSS